MMQLLKLVHSCSTKEASESNMKKLLKKFIMTVTISASLLGFIGLVSAAEKVQSPPSKKEQSAVKEKEPTAGESMINLEAGQKGLQTLEKKYYYDSKGKADPMNMPWLYESKSSVPAGTKEIPELVTSLPDSIQKQVTGVVWSEREPLALVGDKIVHEGDEIAHAKVVKINQGEVIFLYSGKMFPVKISG